MFVTQIVVTDFKGAKGENFGLLEVSRGAHLHERLARRRTKDIKFEKINKTFSKSTLVKSEQ